ncbi:MAG: hypothetical protein HY514_01955 [Candidatus Aenigmarchaeota archaeon]|nr:hypothetical protein [Candidatus Aenigmarchaeota archaeon]
MPYFDTDLRTTLIFAVAGIAVGYLSFLFNHTAGAAVFAIIIFIVLYFAVKKLLKVQEEKKWWTTMAIVYFLVWLIVWTVFYNTAVL